MKNYSNDRDFLTEISINASKLIKKKITLEHCIDNSNLSHSGEASFGNTIRLKGKWYNYWDYNAENIAERCRLYYVIGHELGHKDCEPIVMLPFLVTALIAIVFYIVHRLINKKTVLIIFVILCAFAFFQLIAMLIDSITKKVPKKFYVQWNHIREIRADYCGIIFAMMYITEYEPNIEVTRKDIINMSFPENESNDNFSISHPSLKARKEILLEEPIFDKSALRRMMEKLNYKNTVLKMISPFAFKGQFLNSKLNK